MMQRISKKAGMSCVYTCHSVRASTITTLFRAGVSTQSIISITKHKSTSSLNHYIQGLSAQQKRDCANVLSTAMETPQSEVQVSTTNYIQFNVVIKLQFYMLDIVNIIQIYINIKYQLAFKSNICKDGLINKLVCGTLLDLDLYETNNRV